MNHLSRILIAYFAVAAILLNACAGAPAVTLMSTANAPIEPTELPTLTSTPVPSATPVPGTLYPAEFDAPLPEGVEAWSLGDDHIGQVAYSPDGRYLAVSNSTGVLIYDPNSLVLQTIISDGQSYSSAFAWSPDGQRLTIGFSNGEFVIWDMQASSEISRWEENLEDVWSIAWHPNRSIIAIAGKSAIDVRDVDSGISIANITLPNKPFTFLDVAWSPDGNLLAGVMGDRVYVWDSSEWALVDQMKDPDIRIAENMFVTAWSPDGTHMAAGEYDGEVVVWDVATGIKLQTLRGHGATDVTGLEWLADGKRLVTSALDGTIRVWNTDTGEQIAVLDMSSIDMNSYSIDMSPDGATLAVGTYKGFLLLWDVGQLP